MQQINVRVGGVYEAKVGNKLAKVKLVSESPNGGWIGQNLDTGRTIWVKSARRLRRPVGISATTSRANFWTQWHALKDRNLETILLFRMGDFFEAFGVDAAKVAGVLCVAITSRIDDQNEVDMAGFPYVALGHSLAKLTEAGYRVAVCERMDGPVPAGRSVERIVTPVA